MKVKHVLRTIVVVAGLCIALTAASQPPPDSTVYTTYFIDAAHTNVAWSTCGQVGGTGGCFNGGTPHPRGVLSFDQRERYYCESVWLCHGCLRELRSEQERRRNHIQSGWTGCWYWWWRVVHAGYAASATPFYASLGRSRTVAHFPNRKPTYHQVALKG